MTDKPEPLGYLTDQTTYKLYNNNELLQPHEFLPTKKPYQKKGNDCYMEGDIDEARKQLGDKISKLLRSQRMKTNISERMTDQKDRERGEECGCEGSAQCCKKITYLENKVRYLMDRPYTKEVSSIYDIEKLGLENKSYLVEFTDGTLEKLSVKFIKKHYLQSYAQYLQRCCFKSE